MCEKIEKKHRLSVGTVGKLEKKRSGEESGAGRNQPSSLMIIRFEQFQNNLLIKILDPSLLGMASRGILLRVLETRSEVIGYKVSFKKFVIQSRTPLCSF